MKLFKKPDFYRFILLIFVFTAFFCCSVHYLNAAVNYDQQIPLKLMCILFAVSVLIMMDVKMWFHVFTLIFLPICFFATKILYEKHILADFCNYTEVDVLRLNKINILLWGIVIIAVLRDFIKNKGYRKFTGKNKFLMILWAVYAIWITASQQTRYAYVLLFSVGFTGFYYVSVHPERKRLFFKAFIYGIILSSFYVMYKSLCFRPYDTERYNGYFSNSNRAGFYYSTVFLALFSRIHAWWNAKAKKSVKIPILILLFLYTGFLGCINIFNYTRTTLFGLLFSFAILFVLELIRGKGKRGSILLKYALTLASMVLLFNATYAAIRYIPAKVDNPHFFMWECNEEYSVLKGDPIDSPKYTSKTQFLRVVLGKWGIYIKVDDVEANEFELEHGNDGVTYDKDRDVTNGRTEIWKEYLPRMRFLGHDPAHLTLEDGEIMYHAHNTYFQTAYQFGIPAGIMLLVLVVSCFFLAGKQIIKKEDSYERIFSFLIIGTCLIGFLTEWFGHFGYPLCMALHVAFGYIFHDSQKEQKEGEA
ncbi:MAG: hypothetical protein MJ105_02600 [Lachnospiraceae bacterium]|nr:hypothetical protein [Lachnospiraceae bacterium]